MGIFGEALAKQVGGETTSSLTSGELLSPDVTQRALAPVPDVATAITKAGIDAEVARLSEINALIASYVIESDQQDAEFTGLAGEAKRLGKIIKDRLPAVYVGPESQIKEAEARFASLISEPKQSIAKIKAETKRLVDMAGSIETRFKQAKVSWLNRKRILEAEQEKERKRIEAEANAKLQAQAAAAGIENFEPVNLAAGQVQAKTVTKSDTGSASSARKQWVYEIEDIDAVPVDYLQGRSVDVAKVMEAIMAGRLGDEYLTAKEADDSKIKNAIRSLGIRNIPGLKVFQTDAIVLRS